MDPVAAQSGLHERCKKTETLLTAVLAGEKPVLDPRDSDSRLLFDQITRMYAGDFLDAHPIQLMMQAGRAGTDALNTSDTRIHPLTDVQFNRNKALTSYLQAAGNRNFQIFGAELAYRGGDLSDVESADNLVLDSGDLEGLGRFLHWYGHNLEAGSANDRKILFVQNEAGFYDKTLEALGLDRIGPEDLRNHYGIVVTQNPDQTRTAFKLYARDPAQARLYPPNPLGFRNGVTLLMSSTQPKKHKETKHTLNVAGHNAISRNANDILYYVLSDPEVTKTYGGNALAKAGHQADRIFTLGYEKVCENIRTLGMNPDDVVFCVNDTGLRLSKTFRDHAMFRNSRHETQPGLDWPGVELGPVMNAEGGDAEFFRKLEEASRDDSAFDRTCKDDNLFIFFKLAPKRDDIRFYAFKGTEKGNIVFTPSPATDINFYSEHFTVPDDALLLPGEKGKTKADLGKEYYSTRSSLASCLAVFLQMAKVPARPLTQEFTAAATLNPYLLDTEKPDFATIQNLFPQMPKLTAPDGANYTIRKGRFDLAKTDGLYDYFMRSQGFLLGQHGDLKDTAPGKRMFIASSVIVAKQVHEESIDGKPVAFLGDEKALNDSNQDINWNDPQARVNLVEKIRNVDLSVNPWGRELLLYNYYHGIGMIKERRDYLLKITPPGHDRAALRSMREYVRGYERKHIPDYQDEIYGEDRTGLPCLTIFGSAGTRNPEHTGPAERVGYEAARRGYHVVTGGGNFGIMGAVNKGVLRLRDEDPGSKEKHHITAIQMPATLQSEGLSTGNDQVIVAATMDRREDMMIERGDVFMVLEGGYGTIRELANFLRRKEGGHESVRGKSLIIVNRPVTGHLISFFDPLLAALPEELEKFGIYVVPDEKTGLDLADRLIGRNRVACLQPSPAPVI